MKRLLASVLAFLVTAFLFGCSAEDASAPTTARGQVFTATITEVGEDEILVMPDSDCEEYAAAANIGLRITKTENLPALQVGDHIRIDYDGTITRSIPGLLGQVYSLQIIA